MGRTKVIGKEREMTGLLKWGCLFVAVAAFIPGPPELAAEVNDSNTETIWVAPLPEESPWLKGRLDWRHSGNPYECYVRLSCHYHVSGIGWRFLCVAGSDGIWRGALTAEDEEIFGAASLVLVPTPDGGLSGRLDTESKGSFAITTER